MTEKDMVRNEEETKLDKAIFIIFILYAISSSMSIAASEGFLSIALIIWFIKLIKNKFKGLGFSPIDLPLLIFVIARLISTVAGIDVSNSLHKAKELLLFFTIYLFRFNIDKKKLKRLMLIMVYATAFIALGRIVHMYLIQGLPFDLDHRLNGFTGGYMTYGTIISFSILMGISLLLFSELKKKERYFLIGALVLLLIAEGMTMTRSAWTGLLAALVFLGIFKNRIILGVVIVGVVLGILLAPGKIRERTFSIFTHKDLTTYTRLKMWNWGIKVFKDHPVFGIGPNNVNRLKRTAWREYPLEKMVKEDMVHQHNNFMHYLVTMGIVGLLSFLCFIFVVFKVMLKNLLKYKKDPQYAGLFWGMMACFIAFLVTGLFEYNFFDSEITMIIFMMIGGATKIYSEDR